MIFISMKKKKQIKLFFRRKKSLFQKKLKIFITFSKETKNFYHLLKKYENYKTLLIDSAKSVYFYGYDALIRNNSFVTSKDIELNEWDN